MTIGELKDVIAGGETLTVEFKSDVKRLPDGELVDSLAAMANSQGGMLLEGVLAIIALIGILTASPTIMDSPVFRMGSIFTSPDRLSDTVLATIPLSFEFVNRSEIVVPHCDKIVGSISDGR